MVHSNPKSAAAIRWHKRNPDYHRGWRLMNDYGLTLTQYAVMLRKQRGKCAICRKPPAAARRLAVDHCHKTKKVRALLCHTCNNLLGVFESRHAQFTKYLEKY